MSNVVRQSEAAQSTLLLYGRMQTESKCLVVQPGQSQLAGRQSISEHRIAQQI